MRIFSILVKLRYRCLSKWGGIMSLLHIGYISLLIAIFAKGLALYTLAGKKTVPFEMRKNKYIKINGVSYVFLFIGIAIIVYEVWM